MPFKSLENLAKPRVGQAMSLGRGHVDLATLVVEFHYQEKVESSGVWITVEHGYTLTEGTHFNLNVQNGTITLLPHAFWDSESTWRAGDRVEPLLYKDTVKHPQRISAEFEYYTPEPVQVVENLSKFGAAGHKVLAKRIGVASPTIVDLEAPSTEAQARLGYDVPEFMEEVTVEA